MKKFLAIWLVLAVGGVNAQTQQDHADDATSWGETNNAAVVDVAEAGDPTITVPGFGGTMTPLTDYFDAQSTGDLEADGINQVILGGDPAVDYAWNQSNTPILEFSETDPLLVGSRAIQDDTTVVAGELVMTVSDCVPGTVEAPETTIERCSAWTLPHDAYCDNALEVTVDVATATYTAAVTYNNDAGRPPGNGTLTWTMNLMELQTHDWGFGSAGERIGLVRVNPAFGLSGPVDCAAVNAITVSTLGNFNG